MEDKSDDDALRRQVLPASCMLSVRILICRPFSRLTGGAAGRANLLLVDADHEQRVVPERSEAERQLVALELLELNVEAGVQPALDLLTSDGAQASLFQS